MTISLIFNDTCRLPIIIIRYVLVPETRSPACRMELDGKAAVKQLQFAKLEVLALTRPKTDINSNKIKENLKLQIRNNIYSSNFL